jgi:hypothetical protein
MSIIIEVEEHDLWVIRYALKVLARRAFLPPLPPDDSKTQKEAVEVLQKLHRQT